ncbi:flagellar operon protein TIGR03826 [Butyrivibrio proteoclasticus]|uniref:Flagellar operon protein TIGR03826 n=1 Tax=Butyrivibrio proteoclasticus TaxID=43305 RepID=A0A1I5UZQ4_9FIRM|nr:flagellar protein [Butyrivibrio proteoclasticus]SFQ00743.1 flagellar operon protein TIGR03826 [Butyrivibrio proteoclasticus]
MNLRNCARCGKMFNYIGGQPICEPCKKAIEEDFQRVKAYIIENPTADLKQIAEDNEVTTKQIQQWIREERLMFAENSPLKMTCEKCGARILTGRFCDKCKASMADNLNNTFARPQPVIQQPVKQDKKAGMRFLDT